MERGTVQLTWEFLASANGSLAFGPMLEIAGLRWEGQLDAAENTPPLHESGTFKAAAPAPGLALDARFTARVRFFARGATLRLQQGSYESAEVGFFLGPYGALAVGGGYRSLRVKYNDDPDWARLRLSGPYLNVALRF